MLTGASTCYILASVSHKRQASPKQSGNNSPSFAVNATPATAESEALSPLRAINKQFPTIKQGWSSLTYLQTIAINGTATHDITPCGWDCGNGYSKLHTPDGQILIPSYFKQISEADQNTYESLGNGALVEYLQGDRTDLVGSRWVIGDTAEIYFKQSFGRIVDDLKNKITYGLQMLLGAIALTPRQQSYNLLVVASLHDSQAFASDLKRALQGTHLVKFDGSEIVKINIASEIVEEGVGALLVSRAHGQQKVALIDLGHGTTITSVFEGNKLLQNSRKIDTVGVHQLCEAISHNLQTRRHLGKAANHHLIREGMSSNFVYGTTSWQFSGIYSEELKGWLASCLVPAWKHLQSRADDLDAIYLVGGGAMLPNVSAISARQGIATIQNSQTANVEGLLKLAILKNNQDKNDG